MTGFPWLTALILLPLAGAAALMLMPPAAGGAARRWATLVSLGELGLSLPLWWRYVPGQPGWQFVEDRPWLPSLGSSWHLGVDGVGVLLVLLTTIITAIAVIGAWSAVERRPREFFASILALEAGMIGTFLALDLLVFYVFWEAMLIPMYLLIGVWGSENRIYAAVKFFLFTFIGSVLMLLAIFWLWSNSGAAGHRTFDYVELLAQGTLNPQTQKWLFAAFALAFAIKVPIWPLHTWLPDAHTEAPAAGSIILAGVMLKMGTFGFIRYAMPLFPQAALAHAPYLALFGVIGIVYGSLMCMAQTDMKRLVAYSSVAHLGFVMLGLSALTAEAVSGAVLQMVNHGISTGALFLLIGYLYERTHTRELSAYGGVARVAPAIAATFLVVTLSSIGLPGTNGFVGEFLILIGTFTSKELNGAVPLAVAGATGVILGAVYMLWMYQRVFLGKDGKTVAHGIADLSVREWFTVAPLLVAIVWIGFFPQPLLTAIKEPVDAFVQRVAHPPARQRADAMPPPSLQPAPSPAQDAPAPRLFMPQRAPLARPSGEPR